jgi:hypothetical protein
MHTTPLVLTVEQRQRLEALLRRPTAAQRLVERALIVLAASDGRPLRAIARDLAMRPATVRKWCRRFELRGIDGLQDRARSGRPRCISASDRCLVIATACQDPAEHGLAGHSNWSASLFAASPPDSFVHTGKVLGLVTPPGPRRSLSTSSISSTPTSPRSRSSTLCWTT